MYLFEILIPIKDNQGVIFSKEKHLIFDKFVISLSGGLTVLKPTKGKWLFKHPDSKEKLFEEEMIPVRLNCSREDLDKIIEFSLNHYNQLAIFAYKISDEVIIKYASPK